MKWIYGCIFCLAFLLRLGSAHAVSFSIGSIESVRPGGYGIVWLNLYGNVGPIHSLSARFDFSSRTPDTAPLLDMGDRGGFYSPWVPDHRFGFKAVSDGAIMTIDFKGLDTVKNSPTFLEIPFSVGLSTPRHTRYSLKILSFSARDRAGKAIEVTHGNHYTFATVGPLPGPGIIRVGSAAGFAGGTATLALSADEYARDLTGAQFTLRMDPDLSVSQEDVQPGGLWAQPTLAYNLLSPGSLRLALASPTDADGPGELLSITFHIPETATPGTEYVIRLEDLIGGGDSGYQVPLNSVNGTIKVLEKNPLPVVEGGLITLSPANLIVRNGRDFSVDLIPNDKIKNISGGLFRIGLSRNTSATAPSLTLIDATSPDPNVGVQVNKETPGEATIGFATAADGGIASDRFLRLNFHLPENAVRNTTYTLALKDLALSIDGKDYTAASSVALATVDVLWQGDVTGGEEGGSVVNVQDALELLQVLVGLKESGVEQMKAADADCNGEVNLSDVVKILKIWVGLAPPCEMQR